MKKFEDVRERLPETERVEVSEDYYLEALFLESSSPTIVFIHGGGGNLWNPYMQLDYFRDKGYSLLTYSLSGYGMSSYRKDQSLDDHVEDLRALIESLGLQDVVLHGHSYGTEIAIEYAKKYSPEGLILASGGAYQLTPDWEKPMLNILLALRLYHLPTNKLLMKKLAGKALYSETGEETVEQILKSNPMPHRRSAWETIKKSFWNYEAGNLEEINVPALILHGVEDGIISLEAAKRTAREIPDAEFEKVSRAGHVPQVEKPEEYNESLQNFLEKHS